MILLTPNNKKIKINIPSIRCDVPTELSGTVYFPMMELKDFRPDDSRWWDWIRYKEKYKVS